MANCKFWFWGDWYFTFSPCVVPWSKLCLIQSISLLGEKEQYGYGSCSSSLWTMKLTGFRLRIQYGGGDLLSSGCFPNQIRIHVRYLSRATCPQTCLTLGAQQHAVLQFSWLEYQTCLTLDNNHIKANIDQIGEDESGMVKSLAWTVSQKKKKTFPLVCGILKW